jgi:hypothetical protein
MIDNYKELNLILEQMRSLENTDDVESAHSEADNLLIETLRTIGGFDSLIEAYENVPKWYA